MEFREEELIDREIEIAGYLHEGISLNEILVKTQLSKRMIAAHLRNMMKKMNCANREELIKLIKRGTFLIMLIALTISAFSQKVFRDCKDCPEMVTIPAGNFMMGSSEKELGNTYYSPFLRQTETPQHRVTIKAFAAGKFDITKQQWAAFVKATGHISKSACSWAALPEDTAKPWIANKAANWNHLGFAQDSSHPVVCISWNDAQDYIQWLSKKTGKNYRMLTEAEWEYAARAGTSSAFPWGDSASHEYANYGTDTTAGIGFRFGRDKWVETSPVGAFPPNQFGLYDMHGNVLQWVEDCVSSSYTDQQPLDGSAYRSEDTIDMKREMWTRMNGKKACSFRICRGGDAWDPPPLIRSASRNWGEISDNREDDYSSAGLSFRVARSLEQAAQTFRDCKDCPEMVVIPSGTFTIGSPDTERGHTSNPDSGGVEGPRRQVHIRSFAAGKFDITKAEWAAFSKETKRTPGGGCGWAGLPGDTLPPWAPNPAATWNNVGFKQDSSHPVVCISWDDATDYTKWLSKKTGFTYRLLSEAEWEYAARAGSTTAYPWGDTDSHEYANYGDANYNAVVSGRDQWLGTSPAGSFPPNKFGLYDMNGNVMQWVEDCFSNSYKDLPADGSPYRGDVALKMSGRFSFMDGKSSCVFHMVRGGCYGDPPLMIRSAYRNWGNIPGKSDPDLSRSAGAGFRIARTLDN